MSLLKVNKKPKPGYVKVTFIVDFAGYDAKKGDVLYVSPAVAERLHTNWNVIGPYDLPIKQKPEKPEDKSEPPKNNAPIMVRVIRSLVSKLGTDWYPNSVHLADPKLVAPYLNSGDVILDGQTEHVDLAEPKITPSPFRNEKHAPNFDWYASHPDWKRQRIDVTMRCLELAFQITPDAAYDTLLDWLNDGKIDFKDDDVIIAENVTVAT